MNGRIWSDGQIVDIREAVLPLVGDAALRGISVFEGLMAYRQAGGSSYAVVSLEPHLDRLARSAELMKIPAPRLALDIRCALRSLLADETSDQVYLRPTVNLLHGYYGDRAQSNLFVSTRRIQSPDRGAIDCIISTWRHISPAAYPHEAKVGALYAFYRLARIEAADAGADEAILLTTAGTVAETPGASIFAVRDGVAHTPPLESGILPSITRATAIKLLAEQFETVTKEEDITVEFLKTAEEVFLTGTMDEIRQVRSIGGRPIGTGRARLASRLSESYLQACRESRPKPLGGTEFFCGGKREL